MLYSTKAYEYLIEKLIQTMIIIFLHCLLELFFLSLCILGTLKDKLINKLWHNSLHIKDLYCIFCLWKYRNKFASFLFSICMDNYKIRKASSENFAFINYSKIINIILNSKGIYKIFFLTQRLK